MSLDKTSRYDRQIRLWGKSGQLRLMNTSIVFRGILNVSGEIAKNLVLSGVKSVFIEDDTQPSAADYRTNFLLQGDTVGTSDHPRASDVCVQSLSRLNPFVNVCHVAQINDESLTSSIEVVIAEVEGMNKALETLKKFPNADLFSLLVLTKEAVVCFFLYKNTDRSYTQQFADIMNGSTMHLKPILVQKAVLSLFLETASHLTFAQRLLYLDKCAAELEVTCLSGRDREDLLMDSKPSLDCSGCTVCGAAVAQHVLRYVSADANLDNSSWLLFDFSSRSVCFGE